MAQVIRLPNAYTLAMSPTPPDPEVLAPLDTVQPTQCYGNYIVSSRGSSGLVASAWTDNGSNANAIAFDSRFNNATNRIDFSLAGLVDWPYDYSEALSIAMAGPDNVFATWRRGYQGVFSADCTVMAHNSLTHALTGIGTLGETNSYMFCTQIGSNRMLLVRNDYKYKLTDFTGNVITAWTPMPYSIYGPMISVLNNGYAIITSVNGSWLSSITSDGSTINMTVPVAGVTGASTSPDSTLISYGWTANMDTASTMLPARVFMCSLGASGDILSTFTFDGTNIVMGPQTPLYHPGYAGYFSGVAAMSATDVVIGTGWNYYPSYGIQSVRFLNGTFNFSPNKIDLLPYLRYQGSYAGITRVQPVAVDGNHLNAVCIATWFIGGLPKQTTFFVPVKYAGGNEPSPPPT